MAEVLQEMAAGLEKVSAVHQEVRQSKQAELQKLKQQPKKYVSSLSEHSLTVTEIKVGLMEYKEELERQLQQHMIYRYQSGFASSQITKAQKGLQYIEEAEQLLSDKQQKSVEFLSEIRAITGVEDG
ncbi:hypothetical protein [Candidatus Enterococcus clewellii]|uniref:Uncharacterized protein n=1 Tax=Candidatus Enterococcus clewellii TaxID=1834193 RepID=A0A242KCE2_9ENTE|nr:hypothetical protein [Enterococcus sp. 9E7_DIV0242]OTP18739.1 hypothetical protein A5888_000553 [Enterococcus sp. 9E7_DIV0242]